MTAFHTYPEFLLNKSEMDDETACPVKGLQFEITKARLILSKSSKPNTHNMHLPQQVSF